MSELTAAKIKNLKVAELKTELSKRSLSIIGRKDELASRLLELNHGLGKPQQTTDAPTEATDTQENEEGEPKDTKSTEKDDKEDCLDESFFKFLDGVSSPTRPPFNQTSSDRQASRPRCEGSIDVERGVLASFSKMADAITDLHKLLLDERVKNQSLLQENFGLKIEIENIRAIDTLDNKSDFGETHKIVYESIQVENDHNGNDKQCTKTHKNNRKRNNKRRNKKTVSSAPINLNEEGIPSGDLNNENAGVTQNAKAQKAAESNTKTQQPSANEIADGSSPVNENRQSSTNGISCESSKGPNKKTVPSAAVSDNQPSTSSISNEDSKSHNKKTKIWGQKNKRSAVILGDSLVKNVRGWELKEKCGHNNNVYVKCFSGANIKDMHSYAKPTIERKPNVIILHIGTNDLAPRRNEAVKSEVQIAQEIIELANETRQNGTEVVISGLVPRGDEYETKCKRVNFILADLCSENNYVFIEHTNIDASKHLNQSLIHLNRAGAKLFETNLVRALCY